MSKTKSWPCSFSCGYTPCRPWRRRPRNSIVTLIGRPLAYEGSYPAHGLCDGEGIDVLPHVVHAQDRRAALVRRDRCRDARAERTDLRIGIACDLPERALAGESEEQRTPERQQHVDSPQQLQVVLDRLAEADAG